jgi:hypothetical protein
MTRSYTPSGGASLRSTPDPSSPDTLILETWYQAAAWSSGKELSRRVRTFAARLATPYAKSTVETSTRSRSILLKGWSGWARRQLKRICLLRRFIQKSRGNDWE